MKIQPPSIFNDVIGPVMRGPSSSHTAASVRIGKLVRQFFASGITSFHAAFDPGGSLASTYSSQASDIGLAGGLLNMDLDDPGLVNSLETARDRGIDIKFQITEYEADHPNTYRITARGEQGEDYLFVFVSTGGGMLELRELNGAAVSICGDFHETLLFLNSTEKAVIGKYIANIEKLVPGLDYCSVADGRGFSLVNIKTGYPLPAQLTEAFDIFDLLEDIVQLEPVLPLRSRKNCTVPYEYAADILADAEKETAQLWELAVKYESARGDISEEEVMKIAGDIAAIMKSSIETGLAGTEYEDRILGPQALKMLQYDGKISGGERDKRMIAYITAIMETKSAMGVIVAAPTAGSCGGLPGTLFAAADELKLEEGMIIKALLAAGLVGAIIARHSTFAAEACGCQAECGAGSGMAAAGLVQMLGGTVSQALDAAAMALQNVMGMVCDPVAERVEVPCLGKNILAGFNAAAAANMALAGFKNVIPLDETIGALHEAGTMIPAELRCTGRAGLSTTASARKVARKLQQKKILPLT